MSVDSKNQQTVGDAMHTALDTYLLGGGNPVQATFGYDINDFQGQSPVVIQRYGPVDATPRYLGNAKAHVWFWFYEDVYVVVGDKNSPTWTNALVVQKHALIEKKIRDFCADQKRNAGVWDMIQYAQPASALQPKIVGGFKCQMRTIALKARVMGG